MWWIPPYHTHCQAVRQVSLVEIIRGLFFHYQQFHPIFRNSMIIYIIVIVAILSLLTVWQHDTNIFVDIMISSFFVKIICIPSSLYCEPHTLGGGQTGWRSYILWRWSPLQLRMVTASCLRMPNSLLCNKALITYARFLLQTLGGMGTQRAK